MQSTRETCRLGWLVCLLICLSGVPAQSQNSDNQSINSLLDQVQYVYKTTPALSADFVQVATLATLNKEQISAGRMYIQKPHSIRWEYTHPASQTILYKNNILQIYTPNRRQVLQSIIKANDRSSVALLFLAGIGTLRESFTVGLLPSTQDATARLRLVPRSTQAGFTELQIAVNRKRALIETLTIHDQIGNRTHIRLAELQPHTALPDDTFELILPPDTEVLTPSGLSR